MAFQVKSDNMTWGGGKGERGLSARKEKDWENNLPMAFFGKEIAYVVNNDVPDAFVFFPFIH